MEAAVLTADLRVACSKDQVFSDLDGEAVILQLTFGTYFVLNELGSEIWHMLQTPRQIAEIRDHILVEYDVELEQCERDLLALLEELLSERLIRVADDSNCKTPGS